MALTEIPLRALPNQALSIVLGEQDVTLRFITRDVGRDVGRDAESGTVGDVEGSGKGGTALFCDCMAGGAWVWRGRICHVRQGLKRYEHLPFAGDFVFLDLEGDDDPQWSGLGTRWVLLWGTDADFNAAIPSGTVNSGTAS